MEATYLRARAPFEEIDGLELQKDYFVIKYYIHIDQGRCTTSRFSRQRVMYLLIVLSSYACIIVMNP